MHEASKYLLKIGFSVEVSRSKNGYMVEITSTEGDMKYAACEQDLGLAWQRAVCAYEYENLPGARPFFDHGLRPAYPW